MSFTAACVQGGTGAGDTSATLLRACVCASVSPAANGGVTLVLSLSPLLPCSAEHLTPSLKPLLLSLSPQLPPCSFPSCPAAFPPPL